MKRPLEHEPHTVYRYYDVEGRCLYIGVTCDFEMRDAKHRRDSQWHPQVQRVEFEAFPDRVTGRRGEFVAIQTHQPLHNRQMTAPIDYALVLYQDALSRTPERADVLAAAWSEYAAARPAANRSRYQPKAS